MIRPTKRRFTLIEMLVVVGIILILTLLAVPGITKFLEGQSLEQSGRVVQSAFNEARRASITQRTDNYIVFYREAHPDTPGRFRYGMRRYRSHFGYEGDPQLLIDGVEFEMDGNTASLAPMANDVSGVMRGCAIPIFDGLPDEDDTDVFTTGRVPKANSSGQYTGTRVWLQFQRDGSLKLFGNNKRDFTPFQLNGLDIFDPNNLFELDTAQFDDILGRVDMYLKEEGSSAGQDRRCFVDIDQNAGRARYRVLQVAK